MNYDNQYNISFYAVKIEPKSLPALGTIFNVCPRWAWRRKLMATFTEYSLFSNRALIGTLTMGWYQNSVEKTVTLDIKFGAGVDSPSLILSSFSCSMLVPWLSSWVTLTSLTSVNFWVFWTPSPLSVPNPHNFPSLGQNMANPPCVIERFWHNQGVQYVTECKQWSFIQHMGKTCDPGLGHWSLWTWIPTDHGVPLSPYCVYFNSPFSTRALQKGFGRVVWMLQQARSGRCNKQ